MLAPLLLAFVRNPTSNINYHYIYFSLNFNDILLAIKKIMKSQSDLKEKLTSFPDAVWVQIHNDQMQVLTHDHQIVAEQNCPLAFIERGSFVRNYHVAEQCFNQLIQQIHFKWYEFGQPVIFI